MADKIAAIETEYAGCRFRSRLEARWAVAFDDLGVRWEYEPEGLDLDGIRYLPDFFLPDLHGGVYAEVKGQMDLAGMRKVLALVRASRGVLVLGNIPRPDTCGPHFYFFEGVDVDAAQPRGRSHQVSFTIGSRSGVMLLPLGWPVDFRGDEPDERVQVAVDGINDPERMQGWVKTVAKVADAYTAGRSARFEHWERG